MRAVFLREWRSFFRSLRGYVFLGAFLFLSGLFITVYHFIYGTAAFEVVLELLSAGVAFLLPLLAIPLFAAERSGGDELLRLLPLSGRQIRLGKYLFGVSILGLMTAILGLVPLLLGYLTDVNLSSAYAALLGFLLLEHALLCLSLWLSAAVKKPSAAWGVSYGILVALTALQSVSGWLVGMPRRIVESLSFFGAFSSLGEGRAELRTVILYLSLAALFLLLYGAGAQGRTARSGVAPKGRGILAVSVVCVCAILLNTVCLLIPVGAARLDLTGAKYYSISEKNRTLLSELDEDVTLYVMNADRSDRKLEAYLETLDGASSHLSVRYADGEKESELLARANLTPDTTLAYTMVAATEDRATYVDYIDLFYYENGNANIVSFVNYYRSMTGAAATSGSSVQMGLDEYYTYYNLLGQSESYAEYYTALVQESYLYFRGELLISMIEYVTADLIPTEYILTGHGEMDPKGTLLYDLMSSFGEDEYRALDLSAVSEIPADAASVLLAMPKEDYSEAEIGMLKDYLARGGTLSVVTGQSNLTDTPTLMSFLASYGLTATAETVRQTVEKETDETDGETGEPVIVTEESDVADVKVNTDHQSFVTLAGESALAPAVKGGNPIFFAETEDPSLVLTPLLTTSEKAYLGEDKSATGAYVLAAAAENGDGARLCWMTGGESYAVAIDEYSDAGLYDVFLLAMTMKWTDLVFRTQVETSAAKLYEETYLAVGENTPLVVGIVTILILPLALVSTGWIIRYKRKKA